MLSGGAAVGTEDIAYTAQVTGNGDVGINFNGAKPRSATAVFLVK